MTPTAAPFLRTLLLRTGGRSRLGVAWAALFAGTLLLLLAVALWWNFNELLAGRSSGDALGSTFLTVSKTVTDADMGQPDRSRFSPADLDALRQAPQVQDVGALSSASFPVQASLGGRLGLSTLLFLEAAPDRFLDQKPAAWTWQDGDASVPVLLSRDFLSTYNYVFAPSQGLPQLSENAVRALGFTITIGQNPNTATFQAQVAGFSDRIASVLVPQSFLETANTRFGSGTPAPSRVLVRAADPSDAAFVRFLTTHGYTTNAESLRWNRLRGVVTAISTGTGVLALLLLAAGLGIFVLFLELTLARARDSLQLLLELGYSPRLLRAFLLRRFLPLAGSAVLLALAGTVAVQGGVSVYSKTGNWAVPALPGMPVWIAAGACGLLLWMQLLRAVRRSFRKAI